MAGDMFLKLDGIDGEFDDARTLTRTKCEDIDWSFGAPIRPRSPRARRSSRPKADCRQNSISTRYGQGDGHIVARTARPASTSRMARSTCRKDGDKRSNI